MYLKGCKLMGNNGHNICIFIFIKALLITTTLVVIGLGVTSGEWTVGVYFRVFSATKKNKIVFFVEQ